MTIAQGINKQVRAKKQAGLGTLASGAGAQIYRRRTSIFQLQRDTYESDEIVSHQMSTGAEFGLRKVTGKLSGLLSPGTYGLFFQSAVRAASASGATTGAILTVAATIGPVTFTRSAGSYLTDGFKVGDIVRWAGWATTAVPNNARNFMITSLTATIMSGVFLDGTAGGAKVAGDSVTCTVVNKKCKAPLTGQTDDLWTFEEWYPDIVQSETFQDCKLDKLAVGLPATGNATVDFDWVGLNRLNTQVQNFTAPAAETTTSPTTAVNGMLLVNGVIAGNVTGLQFTVDENVTPAGPVIGSNFSPDLSRGKIKVTGQFTALFSDLAIANLFINENIIQLVCAVTVDFTATSDFVAFNFPAITIHSDSPDDGEKAIVKTYQFTAEICATGGTALAQDQTILSVQDSVMA